MGSDGHAAIRVGDGCRLKTSFLPICYQVKFGSSASKAVRRNKREPKIGGALGRRFAVGACPTP